MLSFKNGGLQLRDLSLVDMSLKMAKIHDVLKGKPQFWHKMFCSMFKMDIQHVFVLNYSYEDCKKYLKPAFFTDVCKYWAQFNFQKPIHLRDILQQPIWYNSYIKSNNKWIFNLKMYQAGVFKVIDLFDLDTGVFMTYEEFNRCFPGAANYIQYYKVIKAIPKAWKEQLLENKPDPQIDTTVIPWKQRFENVKVKPSKFAYTFVRDRIEIDNDKLRLIWQQNLGIVISHKRFASLFNRIRKTTISTKLRFFQYRIVCNILTVNARIAKWDKNVDVRCTMCKQQAETVQHLLFECPHAQKLWKALKKWLKYFYKVNFQLFKSRIILGDYSDKDAALKNIIALITKFYIYRARCQNSPVSFTNLITEINDIKSIEYNIAIQKDKVYHHAKKWSDFSVFN